MRSRCVFSGWLKPCDPPVSAFSDSWGYRHVPCAISVRSRDKNYVGAQGRLDQSHLSPFSPWKVMFVLIFLLLQHKRSTGCQWLPWPALPSLLPCSNISGSMLWGLFHFSLGHLDGLLKGFKQSPKSKWALCPPQGGPNKARRRVYQDPAWWEKTQQDQLGSCYLQVWSWTPVKPRWLKTHHARHWVLPTFFPAGQQGIKLMVTFYLHESTRF